ncbi:hypothetical protein C0J52_10333 [Blattella germanica]|nr:hypothetical protein C0J52_10333 [Blattella germanica]
MHLYISTVRSTLYVTFRFLQLFSTVVVNNDDAMEAENLENEYRNSAFALYSTTSNSLPKHDSNHRAEGNENCLFQDLNSPDRLFFPGIFPTQHPSFFQSIESVLNPPPPYPTRSQLPPPPYPTRSQLPPDTLPQSEVPAATLPTGAIPNITEGPGGLTLPSGFSTETAPLPPLQLFSSRWRQSAPPNIDIPKFPISEINTVQSSINTASADTAPFLGEPLGSFAQTQTTDSAVFKIPQSKDRTTVKRPSTGELVEHQKHQCKRKDPPKGKVAPQVFHMLQEIRLHFWTRETHRDMSYQLRVLNVSNESR